MKRIATSLPLALLLIFLQAFLLAQAALAAPTCGEAIGQARANTDMEKVVELNETAIAQCRSEFKHSAHSDRALLTQMMKRCAKSYAHKQGDMFPLLLSNCRLGAVEFIQDVLQGDQI